MGLSVDRPRNAVATALGDPITLRRGDRLPNLVANLFDRDGVPASLPGTLTFVMRDAVTHAVLISAGPVALEDPGVARVRYEWEAGTTDLPGFYEAWFVHLAPDGRRESYPSQGALHVRVEP